MPTLDPTDVPRRIPTAQVVDLADGRILVRGPDGVRLLGGIRFADLRRLLPLADGSRTVAEICRAVARDLDAKLDETALRRLLGELAGDLLTVLRTDDEAAEGGDAPRLTLLGDGELARRLAAVLGDGGSEVRRLDGGGAADGEAVDLPADAGILLCALEDAPYRLLFAVQRAALRSGVACLFVTLDPDGTRVGPAVVPGVTPCFGCSQLRGFGFLRLPADATLEAVAELRTGRLSEVAEPERVVRAVVTAARTLLAGGGASSLFGEVEWRTPSRARRSYRVERVPGCPLCSGIEATGGDPLAEVASEALAAAAERTPRRAVAVMEENGGWVRRVGILGGGSAGYLAALALRRLRPELEVTLIESSTVPVIGVGEATTPLMPQFLHADLDLSVHRLFREVRPTLKLGIRFEWGSPGNHFNYPFGPVHPLEAHLHDGDVRTASVRSMMMDAGTVPILADGSGWRSELGTEVAYHLENRSFVGYLRRLAAAAGVIHLDATVAEVELGDDRRRVRALHTEDGRRLDFDLYLDCSGFRSLLMGRGLGSPFVDFAPSLPTDAAVVATVPREGGPPPATVAETMDAGWCWNTPMRGEDHRGYVFASSFLDPEAAEEEMRRKNPGMGEARLVRFRAGRHRHFWSGNVVALGNAYGFVEPLESTALHLLIRQVGLLVRAFPLRLGEDGVAELLNRRVAGWWDYLRWFLALHYRWNGRLDTPFWRHCRGEVDVSAFAELIDAFRERGPLAYDRTLRSFDYPDPLWGAEGVDLLLLGQGVPSALPRPRRGADEWRQHLRRCRGMVGRAAGHGRALDLLDRRPELLEQLADAFRRAGPAFG